MPATPTPVTSYPASDPGFAAVPVEDLLAGEADLIARIKLCYGIDRDSFERDVLMLVRRYAACVHLLPATADNYFSKPGGLLRLGLETAFFSLQGTDAHIFGADEHLGTPPTGAALAPCDLHRRAVLRIAPADEPYHRHRCRRRGVAGLPAAAGRLAGDPGSERYFLRWRPQAVEARGLGLFALPHVVPPAVMADLSEGNAVIVPHLLASIGGIPVYRDHNILDELVRRSLALVIDRNLVASADRYGSPQYGSHLERYLVDALRRLTSGNSAWIANREKSRLWFGQDGLFLVWPAPPRMSTNCSKPTNWPASPRRPRPCWNCWWPPACSKRQQRAARPGPSSRPAPRPLEAVKLSAPAILLAGIDPPPVALPQALEFKPAPASAPVARRLRATAGTGEERHPVVAHSAARAAADNDAARRSRNSRIISPEPATTPPSATFALQAPMRLNPVVRDAWPRPFAR
jgi:conjugal transfer pilus assembly protein TraI